MAKYFLGSVGEAEAYEVNSNMSGETTMNLVFTSKTLTDSAVNISVNKEQIIDSYNGAPAGVFYHSPSVNITLSDILWNPHFVEAALGAQFNDMCDNGNIEYYTIKITASADGTATIPATTNGKKNQFPTPIELPSSGEGSPYVVIGKLDGDIDWYEYPYDNNSKKIGIESGLVGDRAGILKPGAEYCFKYPIKSNRSKLINVTSRIVPQELFLVITTPVFMADANSLNPIDSPAYAGDYEYISTGKMVGKIIYEVPRWVLDSDMSFSFAASGTAGMQLTGTVLESIDNEEESVFMRLREFIKPRAWYEGLVDLVSSDTSMIGTGQLQAPTIYGIYSDGSYQQITSTPDDVKLVYKPDGASTSTDGNVYVFDGARYNVTGTFASWGNNVSNVRVLPAVTWVDDEGEEVLVVLNDIYWDLNIGG